jgi:hypothetical protein
MVRAARLMMAEMHRLTVLWDEAWHATLLEAQVGRCRADRQTGAAALHITACNVLLTKGACGATRWRCTAESNGADAVSDLATPWQRLAVPRLPVLLFGNKDCCKTFSRR